MTFVRNRWYVAAWDHEAGRVPLARTVCGEPIVLYRKLAGEVVAMRDACPHRLFPLSEGLREGDSIRCRYHGLKVGADGVAEEMPLKSERVNKKLCVPVYPAVERHRFVWVWIGDPAKADPNTVPDLWPCSRQGWVFDGDYNHVKCDYRLLIDNLMDLTHETYVHVGSIGQPELMEVSFDTSVDGDHVTVTRWMEGVDAPPFWRSALKKEGPVDRWQICHFVEPSSVMIDVGVAPVGAGATVEDHDQGVRGFVIDAMTPETETTTHYFWGMARNFDLTDAGVTGRLKAQQNAVFEEDYEVLELQQRSIDANPDLKLRTLSIDSGGAHARRIIERLAAQA
ncbi:MAG: aromatic ring-hydroxylating dioxygenase subunit alpha [Maricaulaceae bacterium]|jgi:vanillate O-demethylase monooxygenase subunit